MDLLRSMIPLEKKYGSRYFYLGMYLRTALSLLIDGDWTDTACFSEYSIIQKNVTRGDSEDMGGMHTEF